MNLKEAFRLQNKIDALIEHGQGILVSEQNITTVRRTYLKHKVDPEAEDETVEEIPEHPQHEHITQLCEFLLFLLNQKELLCKAIREAKAGLEVDIDHESSVNKARQTTATILSGMATLKGSETIRTNGGTGYRFNAEGNQVSYRCDVKSVTTINYDRNKVRTWANKLFAQSDAISKDIDRAIVNTEISYVPFCDVNLPFDDVFEDYLIHHT